MTNYYSEKLNSNSLQKCYEIAPQRVKQYLASEIDFVLAHISSNQDVLDLGCGYGRVAEQLAKKAKKVVGIDISEENIQLAKEYAPNCERCQFYVMDAKKMDFQDNFFDATICIQNGISAFKVNPAELLEEALRVTKNDGIILFSSYSESFWECRLEWFRLQSEHGLIGEIDFESTKDGIIVCKDGFRAMAYSADNFNELTAKFNIHAEIHEIDNSSIFCKIRKK